MAYTQKTWQTGNTLTAEGMNNIETGIILEPPLQVK